MKSMVTDVPELAMEVSEDGRSLTHLVNVYIELICFHAHQFVFGPMLFLIVDTKEWFLADFGIETWTWHENPH